MSRYRPWGPLHWLAERLPDRRFGLLGSLSTEDRCAGVIESLGAGRLAHSSFLKILDPEPALPQPFAARYEEVQERLIRAGSKQEHITEVPLLASLDVISESLDQFLQAAGENVILDITAMPKHWFFPLTKLLVRNPRIRTLLVTYASAAKYGENLSFNPDPLRALPGFASDDARTAHRTAVVAVGFEPLGVQELYRHQIERVRYIFPFPPGPPGFNRNWGFVRKLERAILNREAGQDDRWHIDMYDCPSIFEALCRETENGAQTSVLAPYGPKTTSLAMCLFAIAVERAGLPQAPVYYAQPKRYDINYSSGLRMRGDHPDILAYCIRLDGRDLYDVPAVGDVAAAGQTEAVV